MPASAKTIASSSFVYQFDFARVVLSDGQFVAAHADLDRIAHRRNLDQRNLRFRDQPHVQQAQPQRARTSDRTDRRRLPDLKLVQRHLFRLPATAVRKESPSARCHQNLMPVHG